MLERLSPNSTPRYRSGSSCAKARRDTISSAMKAMKKGIA
jgi:hypothetical protein